MSGLPSRLDEVTPDFLTAVLSARHDGVEVSTVHLGEMRSGTSSSVPISLDYSSNRAGLPGNMYLKASFVRHGFAQANLTVKEALFYDAVAASVGRTVNLPAGYRGVTDGADAAIVLIEDLRDRGARFGEATTPTTVDEVARGIEQLAGLHAAHWGADRLAGHPWLGEVAEIQGVMRYLVTPAHFDRYIGRLPASVLDRFADRDRVAKALERMFQTDASLPRTLVHGDPHLGNTFREPDGRPGFLDWQFVGVGPYIWDVTYYLTGALTPADRRAAERDLLTVYREHLAAAGVDPPSADEIWLAHRRHMVHGFLSLLTPEDSQPESFAVAMGERFAVAAADLSSLDALLPTTWRSER